MRQRSERSGSTQKKTLSKAMKNGRRAIDELNLYYNRDDKKQITKLASLLGQYLKYPSVQQAQRHRRANKLGALDQKTPQQIQQQLKQQDFQEEEDQDDQAIKNQRQSMKQQAKQENKKKKKTAHCDCCGMAVQNQQLSLLTHTHHVNHIGMSTYLYFMTVKNLTTLLLIMVVAFGLFAGASNVVSSKLYKQHVEDQNIVTGPTNMTYQSFLQFSLGSKHYLTTNFTRITFEMQCWLGLITIILWGVAFVYAKKQQKIFEDKVDFNTASAGDFTLEFSNIPPDLLDICTKQQIQKILISYKNQIKQQQGQHFQKIFSGMDLPIQVYSVNLVSWLDLEKQFDEDDNLENPKLKEYEQKIKDIQQIWRNCIVQKKKKNSTLNYDQLKQWNKQYNQTKKLKKQQKTRLLKQLYGQQKQQKKSLNYSLFVTFEDTRNKQLIQRLHDRQKSFIHKLPCIKQRAYLTISDSNGQQHQIEVEPAPEPQDIIWANYNISQLKRWTMRSLTFFVTVVTLSASFFAVYFLTEVQIDVSDDGNDQKSIASTLISFAISGVLFAVNFLIAEMINRLTKLQRNTTYTREQTSIGVKSILAQLINSIMIPIAINKIIKKNLYGVDGLADDVFYQALTFAFLTPLLKVINPSYIKYLVTRWWYNRPWKRIDLSQKRLNKLNQELEFEIGSEYVEVISMFLFAAFYASLQPTVVPIIAAGLFAMYYAQKFSLYRISKRPTPGNNQINTVLYNFIFMGPLLFAIGSFCWTDILVQQKLGRIPNSMGLVLAIAIFLTPYQEVIRPFIKTIKTIRVAKYSIDRFLIPSQYATFNPLTRQTAKQQYRRAKQQFLFSLKNKSKQQKQQLQRRIQSQNMYGTGEQHEYQSQQSDDDSEYQPYYEIYINNSSMQLLEKQTDQLQKWLKIKQHDEAIKDIPYYIYNGDYQNEDLNVVEVNFEELDEEQSEGQYEVHQFQGYDPDNAQFESDREWEESSDDGKQSQHNKQSRKGEKDSQLNKSKNQIIERYGQNQENDKQISKSKNNQIIEKSSNNDEINLADKANKKYDDRPQNLYF